MVEIESISQTKFVFSLKSRRSCKIQNACITLRMTSEHMLRIRHVQLVLSTKELKSRQTNKPQDTGLACCDISALTSGDLPGTPDFRLVCRVIHIHTCTRRILANPG